LCAIQKKVEARYVQASLEDRIGMKYILQVGSRELVSIVDVCNRENEHTFKQRAESWSPVLKGENYKYYSVCNHAPNVKEERAECKCPK
jgi:hypothetical protein